MAYPYGYSNARVRRAAAAAGYEAACAVNNALVASRHHRFAMPRLTVGRGTTPAKFQAAVAGRGVPGRVLRSGRSPLGTPWSAGRGGRYARPCQVCGGLPAARSSPRFAGRQAAGSA